MFSFNNVESALDFSARCHDQQTLLQAKNGRILVCDQDESSPLISKGLKQLKKCDLCNGSGAIVLKTTGDKKKCYRCMGKGVHE